MTVLELKQLLSNYSDDTEVFIDMITDDQYESDNIWVSNVREPFTVKPSRRVKDNKIAQRACRETAGAKKALVL